MIDKMKDCGRRLAQEYRLMEKPRMKRLSEDTVRIAGTALILAVALKMIDTGFAAALGMLF